MSEHTQVFHLQGISTDMQLTTLEIAILLLILHDARISADVKSDKALSEMLTSIVNKIHDQR